LDVIAIGRPFERLRFEIGESQNVADGPRERLAAILEGGNSAVFDTLKSAVKVVVFFLAGKVDDEELTVPSGSASGLHNRGDVILGTHLGHDVSAVPIVQPSGKARLATAANGINDPINGAVVEGTVEEIDELLLPRAKRHSLLGHFVFGFVIPKEQNAAGVARAGDATFKSILKSRGIPDRLGNGNFFLGKVGIGGVLFGDVNAGVSPMSFGPNFLHVRVDTLEVESASILDIDAFSGNLAKNVSVKILMLVIASFVGATNEGHGPFVV